MQSTCFTYRPHRWGLWGLLAVMLLGLPLRASAQAPADLANDPLTLTLEEAVQIALVNNYNVVEAQLDVANANAQIREAWSGVLPSVDASASYTRNLKSANPFAGSDAGGLFGALGFVDWLAYNERARTDDDPTSTPIDFDEFIDRQRSGMEEAGIAVGGGGDNPFAVPNQFSSGISISQTLYNGQAFAAIRAAEQLKELNRRALDRQEQLIVDQVHQTFYQALLAQEQTRIVAQSVERTRSTVHEVSLQVQQGTAPKFQRLSAEVQLANLETNLIQAQNTAVNALDNLKLTIGMPMDQTVRLRGALDVEEQARYQTISTQDALSIALERRPDLEQARLNIGLRQVDKKLARSQYLPTVSAFANFNYIGNVPDNRSITISDPNDPFEFSQRQNDFFSSSYWNPSINAGVQLSWNLFNGFQTSAQVQQRQVAIDRAENQLDQLMQTVRLEVQTALRDLHAAQQRINSQERNVQRAELNYEYASARLQEGVATPLEERDASEQLDEARINYLQAVHDYLVAQSAFETAVGIPPTESGRSLFQMTSLND